MVESPTKPWSSLLPDVVHKLNFMPSATFLKAPAVIMASRVGLDYPGLRIPADHYCRRWSESEFQAALSAFSAKKETEYNRIDRAMRTCIRGDQASFRLGEKVLVKLYTLDGKYAHSTVLRGLSEHLFV